MRSPLDWSLIDFPAKALLVVSVLGLLVALLWARGRRWWLRAVPVSVGVAAVVAVAGYFTVNYLWHPYPDIISWTLFAWAGFAALVLCLSAARMRRSGWPVRALMVLGVLWAVLVVGAQANIHYAAFTTARKLVNPLLHPSADLSAVTSRQSSAVRAPAGSTLEQLWQPPANMPTAGQVVKASIPASGGFTPREALIYLPPAYLATPRPELPVLVLIPGDPGAPRDWIDKVHVDDTLGQFAAQHKGLAPVVVMADQLGVAENNPSCLDSPLGTPQTYLAEDLPRWVSANLQVSGDHRQWAIGGLSSGGTCSLLVALRAPKTFPNVVDMSGQREPILTSHTETVAKLFNGDEAAYINVTPKDIMARRQYPDSNALITVGSDDRFYKPQQQEIYAACRQSGMKAQWQEYPGGHSFAVFRAAFEAAVPWLATRTELTQ
jgi:enterochelin esterase-like enzyme